MLIRARRRGADDVRRRHSKLKTSRSTLKGPGGQQLPSHDPHVSRESKTKHTVRQVNKVEEMTLFATPSYRNPRPRCEKGRRCSHLSALGQTSFQENRMESLWGHRRWGSAPHGAKLRRKSRPCQKGHLQNMLQGAYYITPITAQ